MKWQYFVCEPSIMIYFLIILISAVSKSSTSFSLAPLPASFLKKFLAASPTADRAVLRRGLFVISAVLPALR